MINKIDKVMSYGCNVELNTGFVDQIDGAGVGALACLYKKLVSRGRNLSIVDMHPEPFSMMQNLGLDAILNIKQKINEEKTI